MGYSLTNSLVIGISSRALFDLEEENRIFEEKGLDAFRKYQFENENQILQPGTAFPLVQALLGLNAAISERRLVEVIVISRNAPDTGMRIFNSISHYGLDISRAAFSGGNSHANYLEAFSVDLFLSKSENDVQIALDKGVAAAVLYAPPVNFDPHHDQIRIAFDCDAVIFSEESELIYQNEGLQAFVDHEHRNAATPLPEGPLAKLLKTLSILQAHSEPGQVPVRIALVTARNSPAHARVINTLRAWNVHVDEAFFLGGLSKDAVLEAFRAHIFFDDQDAHLSKASKVVPSARVLAKTKS